MSEKDLIPIDFMTLIIQVLDGSISDARFEELDQFIAEHPEAAQTYMECLASHVGLTDMGQMVPMPEDPTDDWELYSQDELLTLLQEKNLREETVEAPTSLHFSPNLPAEERRRQIELYAREQLESFLRQQHPDHPMTTMSRCSSLTDTLGSLRHYLVHGIQASIKVAKAAAVILIVFSLLGLVGLIAYANRTVAEVVESVDARWDRPLGGSSPAACPTHPPGRRLRPHPPQPGGRGHPASSQCHRTDQWQSPVPGQRLDHGPGPPSGTRLYGGDPHLRSDRLRHGIRSIGGPGYRQ